MLSKPVLVGIVSLFILASTPAYALVTSVTLEKDVYTDLDTDFTFIGTESEGKKMVNVILYNPNGKYVNILSDPVSEVDGTFKTIPKAVESLFTTTGTYNATAFTDQKSEGITIFLNYDGDKVSLVPNFVLKLVKIGNKSVTEKQTLSFTASVTDSAIKDLTFKLEKSPPTGATINNKTGVFSWTPTEAQGPGTYLFDVVVTKGSLESRETISVTVNDASITPPPSTTQPEPEPEPKSQTPNFIDPKKGAQYYLDRYNNEPAYKKWFDTNYPDYTIQEAIELAIPGSFSEPEPQTPNFIDPKKGAQYYLDRYNNEPAYKKWFDTNYPDYTIQEAIELAIPGSFSEPEPETKIAPFVDPDEDPQYYIDRYNNEPSYKAWFDENFPDQTIYEAVGVEEPKTGICGKGTHFEDGTCVVEKQGGGCLIATAAYGTEMSQQVQQLRELRDNTVLGTNAGSSFMYTFNSIYYSFSPTIADWERQSPIFKNVIQIAITPLLTSLSILNYVDIDSESELLVYGFSIVLLNLGMYIVGPTFAIIKARKHLIN